MIIYKTEAGITVAYIVDVAGRSLSTGINDCICLLNPIIFVYNRRQFKVNKVCTSFTHTE
jgi:hypothetical protein